MQVSIEISLYPLATEAFKDEIWAFIDKLNANDQLRVVTNGMSTQVFGDYDEVVTSVMAEVKKVHQLTGSAVFVLKIINGDRSSTEERKL